MAQLRPAPASSRKTAGQASGPTKQIAFSWSCASQGVLAGFARTDAHDLLQAGDEDLAVADLAGVGGLLDRLDHALQQFGPDGDLDLRFGQKIDYVFRAAIQFGVALLPTEPLDFRDRQAGDADGGQRLAHFVQLERLDDCRDEFHDVSREWIKGG